MPETTTKNQYWNGTGRRKTAIASVRLIAGENSITVNGEKKDLPEAILAPLEIAGKKGSYGISVRVTGGGKMSQLSAIRHGIARALEQIDGDLRTTLKKAGFLTRDPREKERKKPGLKRARRAPQWAKR